MKIHLYLITNLITIGYFFFLTGFYHKLLTPRWAQPIARLTYGVYLLNNILQAFDMGIARSARIFSIHDLVN